MTDDLEGRLDIDDLTATKKPLELDEFPTPESETSTSSALEPEPERVKALITMIVKGECKVVSGVLMTFSFGKGWHCALEDVDVAEVMGMLAHYATHKSVDVEVHVEGKRYKLSEDLDFTIAFNYVGSCTFTVAADNGSYVET